MGTNRFYQASVQNLSDQTNSTTTYSDVIGLALDLDPLDQVTFRFMVIFKQSNALDSVKIQFTTPPNPLVFAYTQRMLSASISVNGPLVGANVPQADTPYVSWSEGYIENGSTPGS